MRWYERVVNEEKGINKALPTAQSRCIGLDVCVVAAVLDMVEEVGHHLTFASEKGCIEPKVSSAGGNGGFRLGEALDTCCFMGA